MNWEQFKEGPLTSKYPSERYAIGEDLSGWSCEDALQAVRDISASISPGRVVVELGSFFGAVSTRAILQGNLAIKLVCVDTFAVDPETIPKDNRPLGESPFFTGSGTAWQHFANNTWDDRSRVAPIVADANAMCLRMIYATGLDVAMVYLDADHSEHPVFSQLTTAAVLWPKATILLDDYNAEWPGVRRAVHRAVHDGYLSESEFAAIHGGRLLVINRKTSDERSTGTQ